MFDMQPDLKRVHDAGFSCYKILGLENGVSVEQVRKNYKKLSLKNHPDRVTSNDEQYYDYLEKLSSTQQAALKKFIGKEDFRSTPNTKDLAGEIFKAITVTHTFLTDDTKQAYDHVLKQKDQQANNSRKKHFNSNSKSNLTPDEQRIFNLIMDSFDKIYISGNPIRFFYKYNLLKEFLNEQTQRVSEVENLLSDQVLQEVLKYPITLKIVIEAFAGYPEDLLKIIHKLLNGPTCSAREVTNLITELSSYAPEFLPEVVKYTLTPEFLTKILQHPYDLIALKEAFANHPNPEHLTQIMEYAFSPPIFERMTSSAPKIKILISELADYPVYINYIANATLTHEFLTKVIKDQRDLNDLLTAFAKYPDYKQQLMQCVLEPEPAIIKKLINRIYDFDLLMPLFNKPSSAYSTDFSDYLPKFLQIAKDILTPHFVITTLKGHHELIILKEVFAHDPDYLTRLMQVTLRPDTLQRITNHASNVEELIRKFASHPVYLQQIVQSVLTPDFLKHIIDGPFGFKILAEAFAKHTNYLPQLMQYIKAPDILELIVHFPSHLKIFMDVLSAYPEYQPEIMQCILTPAVLIKIIKRPDDLIELRKALADYPDYMAQLNKIIEENNYPFGIPIYSLPGTSTTLSPDELKEFETFYAEHFSGELGELADLDEHQIQQEGPTNQPDHLSTNYSRSNNEEEEEENKVAPKYPADQSTFYYNKRHRSNAEGPKEPVLAAKRHRVADEENENNQDNLNSTESSTDMDEHTVQRKFAP